MVMRKMHSAGLVDKARLMMKPSEMVDGLQSDGPVKPKDRERDIVSKSYLSPEVRCRICVRCGGKTEIHSQGDNLQRSLSRWQKFEKRTSLRCVCGGFWHTL